MELNKNDVKIVKAKKQEPKEVSEKDIIKMVTEERLSLSGGSTLPEIAAKIAHKTTNVLTIQDVTIRRSEYKKAISLIVPKVKEYISKTYGEAILDGMKRIVGIGSDGRISIERGHYKKVW